MNAYRECLAQPPGVRQDRAALLKLLKLVESADPPIGQIRRLTAELSPGAMLELDERGRRLALRVIKEELPAGGVREWCRSAPREELLTLLVAIIVQGGVRIAGRQRESGKRSMLKLEPIVLGLAKGSSSPARRSFSFAAAKQLEGKTRVIANGRPRRDDLLMLVSYLAMDWVQAIGEHPPQGRSNARPFGRLVHHVFQWLNLPDATNTLRRYQSEIHLEKPLVS